MIPVAETTRKRLLTPRGIRRPKWVAVPHPLVVDATFGVSETGSAEGPPEKPCCLNVDSGQLGSTGNQASSKVNRPLEWQLSLFREQQLLGRYASIDFALSPVRKCSTLRQRQLRGLIAQRVQSAGFFRSPDTRAVTRTAGSPPKPAGCLLH